MAGIANPLKRQIPLNCKSPQTEGKCCDGKTVAYGENSDTLKSTDFRDFEDISFFLSQKSVVF